MNNRKATKRALLTSVMALVMCVVMLVGTTFAWFTDTARTNVNKIQAGNLDVQLLMKDDAGNWVEAENKTLNFLVNGAIPSEGTQILWEPGAEYKLPELKVVNNGNLKLKYKVAITGINANRSGAKLNEVIDWTISNDGTPIDDTATVKEYKLDAKNGTAVDSDILTIKGHMDEMANNDYQGLIIDGVGITVYATQMTGEYDSSVNDYDKNATYPVEIVSVIENAAMTANKDAGGTVTDYTYENSDQTVKTTVPASAVNSGATPTVTIKPTTVDATASATIKANGKDAIAYDITVAHLATGNTEKVTVAIYLGKNLTGVQVYHYATPMGAGDFTYDPATGFVTIETATFSPFSIAFDAPIALGRDEASYTLEQFNALTEIPEGIKTVYLNIGDVSLADGDVTIGNKDICDIWTWDRDINHTVGEVLEDGRKVYMVRDTDTIYSSNKPGITLYISGSVKDNPEGGLNQSNSHAITFSIPDASNVVFTKDFTVNGYFRMYTGWSDGRNLGGAFYNRTVKTVLFDRSTFNGIWIQNGGFFADSLTLDGCTFNAYTNKVSANDSNPLWFCNIRTCDVTVKNCSFKASRPIKVVEQGVFGANVTITGNKFDMSLTNTADDASKPKNDAIMFSTLIGETQWNHAGTLGNVVVSGNEVTNANALLTFFKPSQITMAEGATFKVSNNTLNGAKSSVEWKTATEYTPDFVK